jgi:hypothetical protein
VSDLDVREFDGFAVATMLLNDRYLFEGKEVAETYRSLCVFSKKAGHWQRIAGQTMRPPSP